MSKEDKKIFPNPGDGMSVYTRPEDLPKATPEQEAGLKAAWKKLKTLSDKELLKLARGIQSQKTDDIQ